MVLAIPVGGEWLRLLDLSGPSILSSPEKGNPSFALSSFTSPPTCQMDTVRYILGWPAAGHPPSSPYSEEDGGNIDQLHASDPQDHMEAQQVTIRRSTLSLASDAERYLVHALAHLPHGHAAVLQG